MIVYLAGPDVFLPDAVEIGQRKAAICAAHGLTGLYPLDNAVDLSAAGASLAIFKGNEAMMESADAIIANLTPFRGPSADAGTVYELGYMAGRGKLCLAYSNDPALYASRVARSLEVTMSPDGRLTDPDELTVEDFGLSDNLMMIHALDLHGYPLVTPTHAPADLWHDLACFEACVRLAAGQIKQTGSAAMTKSEGKPSSRKRADVLLVERGLFESRARAQAAIEAGLVTANGKLVAKPSETIARRCRAVRPQPAHPLRLARRRQAGGRAGAISDRHRGSRLPRCRRIDRRLHRSAAGQWREPGVRDRRRARASCIRACAAIPKSSRWRRPISAALRASACRCGPISS